MKTFWRVIRYVLIIIAIIEVVGSFFVLLNPPVYEGGIYNGQVIQSKFWTTIGVGFFWLLVGAIALYYELRSTTKKTTNHKNVGQQSYQISHTPRDHTERLE